MRILLTSYVRHNLNLLWCQRRVSF
jgi:hypothetical protein